MMDIIKNWIAIFFSEKAVSEIKKKSTIKTGLIALAVATLIFTLPTDADFSAYTLVYNFVVMFMGLLILEVAVYYLARFMNSRTRFEKFFGAVNSMLAMSLLFISLPAAILSFLLFGRLLGDTTILNLLFSLIPYYNFVVFGWGYETVSGLKKNKGIILALSAMSLMLAFNILLIFITY